MSSLHALARLGVPGILLLALATALHAFSAEGPADPQATPAQEQTRMPQGFAVGENGELWLVSRDDSAVWGIYHAEGLGSAMDTLASATPDVTKASFPLMTAHGGCLTLVEAEGDGHVSVERVCVIDRAPLAQLYHERVLDLPLQAQIEAIADTGTTLWLATRSWDPKAQATTPSPPPSDLEVALGLPGGVLTPAPTAPPPQTAALPSDAPTEPAVPPSKALRLVALQGMRRIDVAWPVPLQDDAHALIATRGESLLAVILQNGTMETYERGPEETWEKVQDAVPCTRRFTDLRLVGVEGEWILGEAVTLQRASLSVLRGGHWIPAGFVDAPLASGWNVGSVGGQVSLLVSAMPIHADADVLTLFPVNLRGETGKPIGVRLGMGLGNQRGLVMRFQTLVMMLSIGLMIFTWNWVKRVPILPSNMRTAPLARRFTAGMMDFALAVMLVSRLMDLSPTEVISSWLSLIGMGSVSPVPALAAAVLLLVYVTLSEVIFRRTLGKWIMRLEVVSMQGTRPGILRLLLRNALKILEVMAPMLMTFALFPPNHQRLGDRIAGTLVVSREKP